MKVLPSPIPHPLDALPWDVPDWAYECLEWVIGVQWPQGDERAVWDLADAWYAAAADLAVVDSEAGAAAVAVTAGYAGPTAAAFARQWAALEVSLGELPGFFTDLGAAVDSCGAEIEAAKLEVWIEVGLLVIELLSLLVAMTLTAGAATPAAMAAATATRAAIHRIFARLVARLSRPALRRLAQQAAVAGVAESAQELATSAGVQSYQRAAGHRESFDLRAMGMSAVGGLAGGVVGSAAHIAPNPAAGMVAKSGRSAAAESLAETAASLATGGGLPDVDDVGRAATSGAFDHAFVAVSAPRGAVLGDPSIGDSGASQRPAPPPEEDVATGSLSVDRLADLRIETASNDVGGTAVASFPTGPAAAAEPVSGGPVAGVSTAPSIQTDSADADPVEVASTGVNARAGVAGAHSAAAFLGTGPVSSDRLSAAGDGVAGTEGPASTPAITSAQPESGQRADAADPASRRLGDRPASEPAIPTVNGPLRPAPLGADAIASGDPGLPHGSQPTWSDRPTVPPTPDAAGAPLRQTDVGVPPAVVVGKLGGARADHPPVAPSLAGTARPDVMLRDPTPDQLRAIGVGCATYADLGVDPESLSPADRTRYESVLPRVALLPPDQIRFTQRSISPTGSDEHAAQINATGWHGPPIDGVRWGDGSYVTLNNPHLLTGREAGLHRVPILIHTPSERLAKWPDEWPPDRIARHALRDDIRELPDGAWAVGGDAGKVRYARGSLPETYAEAALFSAVHQHSLLPASLFGTESAPLLLKWSPRLNQVDLDDADYSMLQEVRRFALRAADEVQADLEAIATGAAEMRLTLIGTEQRVKELASLARKYDSEARLVAPSVEALSRSLNDVLRFSILIPDEAGFVQAVGHVMAHLPDSGYEIETRSIKNFWLRGNRYFGLNMTVHARSGPTFELQFPTARSWRAGKLTHGLYDVVRREGPRAGAESSARRVHAFLRMLSINRRLELAHTVPSGLDRISEPRDTSFAKWITRKSDVWEGYKAWLDLNGVHFRDIVADFDLGVVDFPIASGLELDDVDVQLLRDLRD